MPLRRLYGWEPKTIIRYVFDGDGQRVGEVHEREPEWDDHERSIMLALTEYRAGACPGCGGPLAETTDPDNEGRYHVPLPTRCHACTPLQIAFEKYEKASQRRALHFHAELLDGPPPEIT